MDDFLFRRSYQQRVLSVAGDALIAYWPLREPSGAVAFDLAGYRRNGAYTGVDLNQPGIGDGGGCPLFDGVNDYCNIYSASLAAAFNSQEGAIAIWVKVANSGVWTDATNRRMICLQASSTNRVRIDRLSANNQILYTYSAGGDDRSFTVSGQSTVNWFHMALTWNKGADQAKAFLNGVQNGATQTPIGVWAGNLASNVTVIGAATTGLANPWNGYLAHAAIWTRALSAAEIAELARAN